MVGKYIQNKWLYRYVWGCVGLFVLSLLMAIFLVAFSWGSRVSGGSYDLRTGAKEGSSIIDHRSSTEIDVRAEEKVARMMAMPVEPGDTTYLQGINPGFVGLFGTEELREQELVDLIGEVKKHGSLVFVDFEGGGVNRVRGYWEEESLSQLCAGYDRGGMYLMGEQASQALGRLGIDGVWAPVVDRTNPGSRILRNRTCSDDPSEIVSLVGGYLEGLESGGVMGVVKHYPGLGGTEVDPHIESGGVAEIDWEVFEPMVRKADGVMVTHVGVGDDRLPCSMSARCLVPVRELEREEEFLVFSDDMNMAAITDSYSAGEAAYVAVMAGVDVLVYGKGAGEVAVDVYWQLVDSYRSDEEFRARVDEVYGELQRFKAAKLQG